MSAIKVLGYTSMAFMILSLVGVVGSFADMISPIVTRSIGRNWTLSLQSLTVTHENRFYLRINNSEDLETAWLALRKARPDGARCETLMN